MNDTIGKYSSPIYYYDYTPFSEIGDFKIIPIQQKVSTLQIGVYGQDKKQVAISDSIFALILFIFIYALLKHKKYGIK